MASIEFRKALFRSRESDESSAVTNIELFFDLVFVFAVTQLSHRLLAHLTPMGALEVIVLFCAVWWLWIYTSWATNWLDPEHALVRGMLIAMMIGGLALSAAVPKAVETSALVFAAAYVTLQLGRTLAIVWASWGHHPARVRNFLRISFYFLVAAPFWIGGALSDPAWRLPLWIVALAIEYAGPALFFWTPGLGASSVSDWDISGRHMAERCSLFIIIALGEAVLVTGASFSALNPDVPTMAAFLTSFLGSAAMWWIYFDTGARRGGAAMESDQTGRLARNAYTYAHMPIVAGIVVSAVGDELMMAHPLDHATLAFVLVTCGGPALFLIGTQAFKWMTADRPYPPLSHLIGLLLLAGAAVEGLRAHWTPLGVGAAATFALVASAIWEWFSLNGGWQRWAPWLGPPTTIALEDSER